MEDRTKYILIGMAIGILIGMTAFFLLLNFRIMGPFSGREFMRPDNLTNFTRNFTRSMV
jgi:uncharacterized membrane protein